VYLLSLLGWVFGVIVFGLMKTLAGVIIARASRESIIALASLVMQPC
jgi:hypothetical protein